MDKVWLTGVRKYPFGTEAVIGEDLGSQSFYSERHGDFDVYHNEAHVGDDTICVDDGDYISIGDWIAVETRRKDLLRDVGDSLTDEGITVSALAKKLNCAEKFTRRLLYRLEEKGISKEGDNECWYPGANLLKKRKLEEEERQKLLAYLNTYKK